MQILDAVDASLEKSVCEKDRDCCDGEGECITFDLWDRLNEEMRRFLSGITLKGLAEQKLLKDQGIQKISIVRNLTEKSQTTPH